MTRTLPFLAAALLLTTACSSSRPAVHPSFGSGPSARSIPRPPAVDPVRDPSAVGAIEKAAEQGTEKGEAAARTGLRIGRVAGVFAAVFGGPECETLDHMIRRYRLTRDVTMVTAAVIGAAAGAVEGAQEGFALDKEFSELQQIDGVKAFRPEPDQVEAALPASPDGELLARVAAVFAGREERVIDITGPADTALDVRDALIDLGVSSTSLNAHRDDTVEGIVLHIEPRA